ncbi:MAG: GIY-YIG nuclease family protein [Bacteroidetes bacterium]|nr:GIY-YIG nuclease family protein [Bacteroidota bacterium]
MGYTVYILYSELKDRYYVGQTENLEKRIAEHNLRKNLGANDWKLVYMEEYDTRSMAMFRESEIKSKKRRAYMQALVAKQ